MARGRHRILFGALAPAALAACGSPGNPAQLVPSSNLSHFIALNVDQSGNPVSVSDRSIAPEFLTVMEYNDGNTRTPASAWVIGILPGGTSIPALEGLEAEDPNSFSPIRTVVSKDGFLDHIGSGNGYSLGRYGVYTPDRSKFLLGYRIVGDVISNQPKSGSATYNGIAHALMFGSRTGARDVAGKAQLRANFDPGAASISGRLSELRAGGQPVGYEIVLNPVGFTDAPFAGGGISIAHEGGASSGAAVYSGDWQGMFYGEGARAAAGTFTLGATNVPMAGGGTESVQGVGGFGASR